LTARRIRAYPPSHLQDGCRDHARGSRVPPSGTRPVMMGCGSLSDRLHALRAKCTAMTAEGIWRTPPIDRERLSRMARPRVRARHVRLHVARPSIYGLCKMRAERPVAGGRPFGRNPDDAEVIFCRVDRSVLATSCGEAWHIPCGMGANHSFFIGDDSHATRRQKQIHKETEAEGSSHRAKLSRQHRCSHRPRSTPIRARQAACLKRWAS